MKKQIFKVSVLTGLMAFSNYSIAEGSGFYNGPYAGVGIGHLNDESIYHVVVLNNSTGAQISSGSDLGWKSKTTTNFSGTLSAGYSYTLPYELYSAAEAKFSYFNKYDVSNLYSSTSGVHKLVYNHAYHLTLKFGKIFYDHFLLYAKGGYVHGDMTFDADADNSGLAKKESIPSNGFEYGIGVASRVSDNMVIGLEASKMVFEKKKITRDPSNSSGVFLRDYITLKPRLSTVELKVTYQF